MCESQLKNSKPMRIFEKHCGIGCENTRLRMVISASSIARFTVVEDKDFLEPCLLKDE